MTFPRNLSWILSSSKDLNYEMLQAMLCHFLAYAKIGRGHYKLILNIFCSPLIKQISLHFIVLKYANTLVKSAPSQISFEF